MGWSLIDICGMVNFFDNVDLLLLLHLLFLTSFVSSFKILDKLFSLTCLVSGGLGYTIRSGSKF